MSFCHSEARRRRARNLLVAFGWRNASALLRLTGQINLNGGFSRRGRLPFWALCSRPRRFSAERFRKRVQDKRIRTAGETAHHFLAGLRGRELGAAVAADESFIFFGEQQNLDLERRISDSDAIAVQTQLSFTQENRNRAA